MVIEFGRVNICLLGWLILLGDWFWIFRLCPSQLKICANQFQFTTKKMVYPTIIINLELIYNIKFNYVYI